MMRPRWVVAAFLAVVLGWWSMASVLTTAAAGSAQQASSSIGGTCLPAASSATLSAEQADNAATIVAVAAARQVPAQGAVVAIAVALQESGLRNLDHGDRDSLGLFQQRPSQGWGTPAQIMRPVYASKRFYAALVAIPGWQLMSVAGAGQAVQHSADGAAYAKWEPQARAVVAGDGQASAATCTAPVLDARSGGRVRSDQTPCAGGGPGVVEVAPGDVPIRVCTVAGVRVNTLIAANFAAMLTAAAGDGVLLGGGGFRSETSQIALRRAHCGPSFYAIWKMPSSACSPPTAIPGTSMHEWGLAIDLSVDGRSIASHSDVAWLWLAAHAKTYGLCNLPSEAWHWSTTCG